MPKPKAIPVARLKERKKPVTTSTALYLDPDVAQDIAQARQAFDEAERSADINPGDLDLGAARDTARKELDRLHDQAVESEAVASFSFQALGRKRFQALLAQYPPTEEQQKELRGLAVAAGMDSKRAPRLTYDSDRFPPVLVAHASVDPVIAEEEALEMWASDDWNQEELGALFSAAWDAQTYRHLPEA